MPTVWIATYRNASGSRSTVWSGHVGPRITANFRCGVMGCTAAIDGSRDEAGTLILHPHKVHTSIADNRKAPILLTHPPPAAPTKPPFC